LRAADVRYASVGAGFLGLEIHGRGTDGEGGSGYTDRLPGFCPLNCDFMLPVRCWRRLRRQAERRGAEGVGGDARFGDAGQAGGVGVALRRG
jgi:hypothetical protein